MGTKIKGIKRFFQNNYEKIIIVEKDNNYVVSVIGGLEENKKINNINDFIKTLKSKEDCEQIKSIISYYLENTTVTQISEYQFIPYYTSSFNIVNGDRDLYFSLHNEVFNDIKTEVKDKYYSDRLKTIEENSNITYYDFKLDNCSSYKVIRDNCFVEKIEFSLLGHKKYLQNDLSINEEEKTFFQEFVYNKLKEQSEVAVLNNNNLYDEDMEIYVNLGHDVTCGDVIINIDDSDLLPEFASIVNRYNKERENIKIKRLK